MDRSKELISFEIDSEAAYIHGNVLLLEPDTPCDIVLNNENNHMAMQLT